MSFRAVPTHHRTPDALRWRSRLALGVGEGQKLTRCIDATTQNDLKNHLKILNIFSSQNLSKFYLEI
jgi:hypothetical protein